MVAVTRQLPALSTIVPTVALLNGFSMGQELNYRENYALDLSVIAYTCLSLNQFFRLRPYHRESTGSRLITEVKPGRAGLVLGWVTAWEYPVP